MGAWTSVTRPSGSQGLKSTVVTHGFLGTICEMFSFSNLYGKEGRDLWSHREQSLKNDGGAEKAYGIHVSWVLASFL